MAIDLRSRLDTVEEDFLNSFYEGTSSLETFHRSWSQLIETLNAQLMDPDTTRLAHEAAHRIESLASDFLDMHSNTASISTSFSADLEYLLGQLNLDDDSKSPSPEPRPSPQVAQPHGCPLYIAPAYQWLLKNIHNPYPSRDIKARIARRTDTSIQNIDAWFLNVRRRIGWTALSKRFFSGSRTETVKAAYRALVEDCHPSREREPLSANVRMAFVQMEAVARELYADKFTKSALAGKLDGLVKDLTDEDKRRMKAERMKEKEATKRPREWHKFQKGLEEQDSKWKEAQAFILSPTPSRSPTPTSVTESNEDGDANTYLPPIVKKKRPSSDDMGKDGVETDALSRRPRKRTRRTLSTTSTHSSISPLTTENLTLTRSSRASQCVLSLSDGECPPPPLIDSTPFPYDTLSARFSSTSLPTQSRTRKRRLSGAATGPACKRQTLVRSRLQVVSDPLPQLTRSNDGLCLSTPSSLASSIAPSPLFEVTHPPSPDWASLFFDTPETAVLDELDLSTLRAPEFSCVAETAALLNGGNGEVLNQLLTEGSETSFHWNMLNVPFHDEPDHLFGSSHPDLTIPWTYGDMTQLLPMQPPITSPRTDEPLATLDDFPSLSSLPMNPPAIVIPSSDAVPPALSNASSLDSIRHVDWLSVMPQPPISGGLASNPTSVTTADEAPQVANATEIASRTGPSAADAITFGKSTTPLIVTPETRAEKYRQYRELLNKAKQLEVELGHP